MRKLSGARQNQLRQRIGRRYQIRDTIVEIGPLRLLFTRIADPDVVLDAVAEAGQQARQQDGQDSPLRLPYWAELWESSIGIAQYLLRREADHPVKRLSVLDLGCGMGLCGCVAAGLGARVCFADVEADALLFARLNALGQQHWVAPKPSPQSSPGVPGEGKGAPRIRTRRLDWGRDRLDERFDVILGGDILYERSQWEPLEAFWRDHLAAAGRIILAEPGRQTGEQFPAWIISRGWQLMQESESVSTRPVPIRIFELARE